MNSGENTKLMENLAKELTLNKSMTGQVVTVNWPEAANDPFLSLGSDAPWTPAVGTWVANQLMNLGFSPQQINGAGHSHGTYVLYFMGAKILKEKGVTLNSLVALDPAGNMQALSGLDTSKINFRSVSRNSVAIEGSLIAGSNDLASTADTSFQIDCNLTNWPPTEHSFAIATFSNMLAYERNLPGQIPLPLTLREIMKPAEVQAIQLAIDEFRTSYEGIIEVSFREGTDVYGSFYEALPLKITTKKSGATSYDIQSLVSPSTIR
jgi:hypothetical protein